MCTSPPSSPQWVCALPFEKPACSYACHAVAGAHASTGTHSQLVLKGRVSRQPGNKTALYLWKLNLPSMLVQRQSTPGVWADSYRRGVHGGSAGLPYRITAPAALKRREGAVCLRAGSRQTPTARRDGVSPEHLNPYKPVSCSHPSAGSPLPLRTTRHGFRGATPSLTRSAGGSQRSPPSPGPR